jgi:putative zinc finger/helix-turn-helix YgiT family protein
MRTIKSEIKLCLTCMEEHEVQTIIVTDNEEFKGAEVTFDATYDYCSNTDEYLETEEMVKANSLAMKDAYREKVGLLTSIEIIAIRDKYGVSQKDFSEILNWGKATITRYENHQVQDRAHDDVLRKIDSDPKWFLQMLKRAEGAISEKAFKKYLQAASLEFKKTQNRYLVDSIKALYANYSDDLITGGVKLNLNKVVEIINYYALKVSSLHKVKLMKMLWYADNLSYKKRGESITGLVYSALKMGAVPEGYEQIVDLDGVEFETVLYEPDQIGYKFYPVESFEVKELTPEDIGILDTVISEVGQLNSKEIIDRMHHELAFKCSGENCIIPFSHSEKLSIH